jgi:iron complex outermembrane recepter protein
MHSGRVVDVLLLSLTAGLIATEPVAAADPADVSTDGQSTTAAMPTAAGARNAPETNTGALQEIIVTARKRYEDAQATPVAITTFSRQDLEDRGIDAIKELAGDTPSLAFQQSPYDTLGSFIGMRGQQQTDIVIVQTPPVAVYVDGVYHPTSLATSLNNFEGVQQIEVLKGPQGTLYGRNTTGGAINITTLLPDYSGVNGTVKIGYGNYEQQSIAGSINLPLIANRATLNVNGQYVRHNGYGADLGNGIPIENLENGIVRAALRLDLAERLQMIVRAEVSHARSTQNLNDLVYVQPGFSIGAAAVATQLGYMGAEDLNILGGLLTTGVPPAGTTTAQLATFFSDVNRGRTALAGYICPGCTNVRYATSSSLAAFGLPVNTPLVPDTEAELQTASVTGTYQLSSDLYLKSITAYQYTQRRAVSSASASPFLLINGVGDSQDPHEITEEVQLGGSGFNEHLKWVAGYYFFTLTGYDNADPVIELVPLIANPVNNLDEYSDISNSAYGQATYAITSTTSFTGGLRYTSERTRLVETSNNAFGCTVPGVAPTGEPCIGRFYNEFNNTSYTAGIDWALTSDLFAYLKTSTGFRAGGTNQRGPAVPFKPETVTDYELGLKSEWFARRLRLNLDVYDSEYKDIQRSVYILYGGAIDTAIENAASARIQGVELETTVLPTDNFKVSANGAFTNPKYLKYMGLSSTGVPLNLAGNAFPNLSRWQGSVVATYTIPQVFGNLTMTMNYSYRSTTDYQPDNHAAGFDSAVFTNQPGFGLLNGRLSQYLSAWDLRIGAWGKNLVNKVYAAGANDFTAAGLGYAYTIPGNPRTFGVDVQKTF